MHISNVKDLAKFVDRKLKEETVDVDEGIFMLMFIGNTVTGEILPMIVGADENIANQTLKNYLETTPPTSSIYVDTNIKGGDVN